MARKKITASQRIREILAKNPNAKPAWIQQKLEKMGHEVTTGTISSVKCVYKQAFPGKGKKRKTDNPKLSKILDQSLQNGQIPKSNGTTFSMSQYPLFRALERQIEEVGIGNAENIIASMRSIQ